MHSAIELVFMKGVIMRRVVISVALISATAILGCRSFTSPARARKLENSSYWVDYDATRRGVVVTKFLPFVLI